MTLKACKYHLKPNAEQRQKLSKAFGHNRFVWNWAMALRERFYRRYKKSIPKRRLQAQLVKKKKQPKFAWLNEVNAQSYLATLDNLDKAYKAFFKGNAKHPRFKSKKSNWHSYQNPQHIELDTKNNHIKIPKIGWVKCKVHRMVKEPALSSFTHQASLRYPFCLIPKRSYPTKLFWMQIKSLDWT